MNNLVLRLFFYLMFFCFSEISFLPSNLYSLCICDVAQATEQKITLTISYLEPVQYRESA